MNIERTNADGLVTYRLIDHGDGHGTLERFDENGNVTHVEQVEGLPIPDPDPADPRERVLSLLASLSPEELSRVITLGLAVTTLDAVTSLAESVATSNPDLGVAVLAEAAQTATTPHDPTSPEEG